MQAQAEIVETEKLLRLATFSGVKAVLSAHLESCKASLPPPPAAAAVAVPAAATEAATAKVASANTVGPMFEVVSDFAWDQGKESISVYVDLAGVGDVKEGVTCDFARDSFDLKVMGLGGKNYRLLQDNLDKDVVVDKCKCLVKANKVVVKLAKTKGEYSFDTWQTLQSKKTREEKRAKAAKASTKENPMGGIMDMMKDMYDSGDDKMKKIIGEAMEKSRTGEKTEPDLAGMGGDMGGMGGMGGLPGPPM